jgi:hypothetical protein
MKTITWSTDLHATIKNVKRMELKEMENYLKQSNISSTESKATKDVFSRSQAADSGGITWY